MHMLQSVGSVAYSAADVSNKECRLSEEKKHGERVLSGMFCAV